MVRKGTLVSVSGLRWPVTMICHSIDSEHPKKSCKSRRPNLWVHFKNTHETAQAINSMHIQKGTNYLKNVNVKKQCVQFLRYNDGVSSCAEDKQWGLKTTEVII